MSLSLAQTYTAVGVNITSSFQAQGGVNPYVYSVVAGGAGGTIDSSTGVYTAPASINTNPARDYDTILVTDALSTTASARILVANPLELVCDIIQNQMGLDSNHVYLWDQKINQPVDGGLYVAVSVATCKPFGNNISYNGDDFGLISNQSINMMALVDIDIISRGPAARDQKEFVMMALNSVYAEQQQEANAFYISRISSNFLNLSPIDGAAIPYRFKISLAIQYTVTRSQSVDYFDIFAIPTVIVDGSPFLDDLFGFRTYAAAAGSNKTPFNTYSSYQTSWPWLSYQSILGT